MHRGAYAVGHAGVTLEGRFMAAVLACGGVAYLSRFSGSAHLGFMAWEERRIEATVIGASARRVDGLRVRRARSYDARDFIRHDGIPVTSPARTLLDLAATFAEPVLRRAVRQAQVMRQVSTPPAPRR